MPPAWLQAFYFILFFKWGLPFMARTFEGRRCRGEGPGFCVKRGEQGPHSSSRPLGPRCLFSRSLRGRRTVQPVYFRAAPVSAAGPHPNSMKSPCRPTAHPSVPVGWSPGAGRVQPRPPHRGGRRARPRLHPLIPGGTPPWEPGSSSSARVLIIKSL